MLHFRRIIALTVTFSFFSLFGGRLAFALPDAEELIADMHKAVAALDSYSFTVHRKDLDDEFVESRNREAMSKYKIILEQLERLHKRKKIEQNEMAKEYKESVSRFFFVKPFTIEMIMKISDFLPSFLQNSKVSYNPETSKNLVFMRTPGFGFSLKNDVTTDSGILFNTTWTYEMIEMDCALANGGEAEVTGTEEYKDTNYIILEIHYLKGDKEWAVGCGGDDYDVPEETHVQLNRELKMVRDRMEKYAPGDVVSKMWVDPKSKLIVRRELTYGDLIATKYVLSDIELNNVDPERLMKPKTKAGKSDNGK